MAFLCVLFHETSGTIGTLETLFYTKNSLKSAKKGIIRLLFDLKFIQKASKTTQKHVFLAQFLLKNQ